MELNVDEIIDSFIDSELLSEKAQQENEFRKAMKFCDLTLKINDKDLFQVHKTIIASSCSYFTAILNGDWKETKENVISLDYKIAPECFEIILDYLYTGKLQFSTISLEKAKIIHQAALFFNLQKLKKIMSRIVEKFITNENQIDLWRYGVKFLDDNLRHKCIEVISKNFVEFLNQNLMELTFAELINLIEIETINISREEIYENLINWIKNDFESRETHLKELLNLIDFSKLSGEFTSIQRKILTDKTMYKSEDFVKKIMEELSDCKRIKLKTNQFRKLHIVLISNTGIFKIDLESKKCTLLLRHKIDRTHFAVNKFTHKKILISGGSKSNICQYYSTKSNMIKGFPSMLRGRHNHKVISINNRIYTFGGTYGEGNTTEIYDLNTGEWSYDGPEILTESNDFGIIEFDNAFYKILLIGIDKICVEKCNYYDDIHFKSRIIIRNINNDLPVKSYLRIEDMAYVFTNYRFARVSLTNDNQGKWILYNEHINEFSLSTHDAVEFNNDIFIFGKIKDSNEFFTAFIDRKTLELTHIQIDLSECEDIGKEFHLTTAHF